jgi:hypothetical protein
MPSCAIPTINSVARAAKILRVSHGDVFLFEGLAGSSEFDVERVSWIIVPVGGGPGVTELGLNVQAVFAGSPAQVS